MEVAMQTDVPATAKVLFRKGSSGGGRKTKVKGWVAEMPCGTRVLLFVDGGRVPAKGGHYREPGAAEKRPCPFPYDTVTILSKQQSEDGLVAPEWAIRSRSVEM